MGGDEILPGIGLVEDLGWLRRSLLVCQVIETLHRSPQPPTIHTVTAHCFRKTRFEILSLVP